MLFLGLPGEWEPPKEMKYIVIDYRVIGHEANLSHKRPIKKEEN